MDPFPTVFIGHGPGPAFLLDENDVSFKPGGVFGPKQAQSTSNTTSPAVQYMRKFAELLPRRPKATIIVSAHWVEDVVKVNVSPRPPMLFDYYNFPAHTYKYNYPAPGDPMLAQRVIASLRDAGFQVEEERRRGFDHGVFVPMSIMFPKAEVPIVEVSLLSSQDPAAHIAMGRALERFRSEDILVLGSGQLTHNLSRELHHAAPAGWQADFEQWMLKTVTLTGQNRASLLAQWHKLAPHSHLAQPHGAEHLLPLMVAVGAAYNDPGFTAHSSLGCGNAHSSFMFSSTQPQPPASKPT